MRRLLLILLLLFCLPGAEAPAQDVQQTLEQSRGEAAQTQESLRELEQREKALAADIERIEAEVAALLETIRSQEADLAELESREEQLRAEYFILEDRREAIGRDLSRLVRGIWPIHMRNIRNRFTGVSSWDEADRRFQWLSAVYRQVLATMREAAKAALERAENLRLQQQLSQEAALRLEAVNADKDQLLRRRLQLRSGLREVQGKKADLEAELRSLLATIKELDYRLKSQRTKRFGDNKGFLPWPVSGGEVALGFSPRATPPRRGIGLKLDGPAEVRSVFWGKVVHNDVLRGFGRVVIVYHGHDYYSLYAFLSESPLQVGQEVEKDEPVGTTGVYPEVKSPGLYFELRFGQKPINPMVWLFPK